MQAQRRWCTYQAGQPAQPGAAGMWRGCAAAAHQCTLCSPATCHWVQVVDTYMFEELSAPSATFALLGQLPPGDVPNKALVQRWDAGSTSFAPMLAMAVDRSSNANRWALRAASDRWAVLTSVKRNMSAPGVPRRVETMVWTGGNRWLRVLPWQLPEAAANADVTALVALPGGALAAMGAVFSQGPGYGLWRLTQI